MSPARPALAAAVFAKAAIRGSQLELGRPPDAKLLAQALGHHKTAYRIDGNPRTGGLGLR